MVKLRRYVAAGFLLFMAVLWGVGATRAGSKLDAFCAAIFALGDLIAATALLRRWFWGRWVGLGIGLVGTLNIAVWLALGYGSSVALHPLLVAQGIGFPSLIALLLGEAMRREFELRRSRFNHWDFTKPNMHLLSWSVVLNIATAPMLLCYGCSPALPISNAVRCVAIAAAAALAVAVVLVILCRSIGLFVMTAAGVATVALGVHALPLALHSHDASQTFVTTLTLAAFPPGILAAAGSIIVFARPIARFVRAR